MLVLIRGAGDLATGVALRLHRCGFSLILTELPQPTAVRRTVAFSEAVYHGSATVEGVTAHLCGTEAEVREALLRGAPAVIIDPAGKNIAAYRPDVLVDAMLAKRNLGHAHLGCAARRGAWAGLHGRGRLPLRGGDHARAYARPLHL